jgi:hypothetical protein
MELVEGYEVLIRDITWLMYLVIIHMWNDEQRSYQKEYSSVLYLAKKNI